MEEGAETTKLYDEDIRFILSKIKLKEACYIFIDSQLLNRIYNLIQLSIIK